MLPSTTGKSSVIPTPVAEMEQVSAVTTVQTSSSTAIQKLSTVNSVTRTSSPRQFFARLYGNLETSGSNTTPPEIPR